MHHYAVFSALYLPHTGGVENFTCHLADALAQAGDVVEIVTMRTDDSPECQQVSERVRVWRLPCRPLMNARLPWPQRNQRHRQLMDQLDQVPVDRVLVNTRIYPHSLDGLRYAQRKGLRAVVLDHGSAHLTLGNALADKAIERYEHRITRKVQAFDPVFAGISAKSAQWLGHFGIDTQLVIPNAIDAAAFRVCATSCDFRGELAIPDDHLLVAFAGRITPEKGVVSLVDAARALVRQPMDFVLAGDGFLREGLQRDVDRTHANVHFAGNLAHGDLAALLNQADVFCLPSRSEGFCTSLLEASACGVPAVVTDVGGARELIPDASYGWILEDASADAVAAALSECLANEDALADMGKRAKDLVERSYSWEATARAVERAFQVAESEGGQGAPRAAGSETGLGASRAAAPANAPEGGQ